MQLCLVFFQGLVTCVGCNSRGDLLASGGSDGIVCLWQWGRDEFLHGAGQIYLTNLPILALRFNRPPTGQADPRKADEEISVSIDTFVMNLRVKRKTSQQYMIDQQPHKHLRMKGSDKIVNSFSMSQVGEADDFLVIRGKGRLELVSGKKDTEKGYRDSSSVLFELGERELCFNYEMGGRSDNYLIFCCLPRLFKNCDNIIPIQLSRD